MRVQQDCCSPRRIQTGSNLRIDPSLRRAHSRGTDKEKKEPETQFSVIGKLEGAVSRVQVAQGGVKKLVNSLEQMRAFLEEGGMRITEGIDSVDVINNYLKEQLKQIEEISDDCSFKGLGLLNGESGVVGTTSHQDLKFVRGSARVISSGTPGYPVSIKQSPKATSLLGTEPVSSDLLKKESTIALIEGDQQIRYQLRKDENPESLIQNLQECLLNHGVDIRVTRTEDNRLLFVHNQLGRGPSFFGFSLNTRMVSAQPGEVKLSTPGRNIVGTIGREKAEGTGGFLIGSRGNRHTDGLILYYNGNISYPGEIVGYVQVKQNGIYIPLDATGENGELLSIPSCHPAAQAVGVSNASALASLGAIKTNTREQARDSLKLILWAIADLKQLQDELKWKEEGYINRTIELLQGSVRPLTAGNEIMDLSDDRAGEMADQLKDMLLPGVVA